MNHTVLMIGWEYPPHITGGLGMACKGLVRALAERGHQVIFLVPRLFGDEVAMPGVKLMDVGTGLTYLTHDELLQLPGLPTNDGRPSFARGVYDSAGVMEAGSSPASYVTDPNGPAKIVTHKTMTQVRLQGGYGPAVYQEISWYADYIALLVPHLEFDIIHCHDWITYPAGLGAKVVTGKPLVAHIHATEFDRSGANVNQFVYDLERECFHRSDAVVTVSNYTRDILVERYDAPVEKIYPIHNGVEFELPADFIRRSEIGKPGENEKSLGTEAADGAHSVDHPDRDRIVLFLGRITFQKGPDYFVRAARLVVDRLPNVRFVMAGDGDMYHRMIEMAADLGLGKYFHYTGFLEKDQVTRLFGKSDLYIMPSVSEPFGLSPLEAMLHGVPVIVSKQSGVSEVIRHCIKVDFWNVKEIAEAIIAVLQDESLSEQLSQDGTSEVRQVTWDRAAGKIEKLYDLLKGDS